MVLPQLRFEPENIVVFVVVVHYPSSKLTAVLLRTYAVVCGVWCMLGFHIHQVPGTWYISRYLVYIIQTRYVR